MSHGSNAGVGQGTSSTADTPQPRTSRSDVEVTDHVNTSASDSNEQFNIRAPPLPYGTDDSDLECTAAPSFTNGSRASSPPLSARPTKAACPAEFSHPAAIEEQRFIWLPNDPLGLVHEIEQELTSQHILYSTEGAEIDSQGNVNVSLASPEEVRRAPMEARPRAYECEPEGDEKGIFSSVWGMMGFVESKA